MTALAPYAVAFLLASPAIADMVASSPPIPRAVSLLPLPPKNADALRMAIARCWNTGALSSDAIQVKVVVALTVDGLGKPVLSSMHLIAPMDNKDATQQMYQSARRAIIRCGKDGLPMPPIAMGSSRDLELTFDATGMQSP